MKNIYTIIIILLAVSGLNAGNSAPLAKPGQTWQCIVRIAPVYLMPNTRSRIIFRVGLRQKIKIIRYISSKNRRSFDWLAFRRKRNNRIYYTPFEYFALYKKSLINKNLPKRYKIDRWNNIPFNYKPKDLVRIPNRYISPYQRRFKYYLRKNSLKAFARLLESARKAGYKIYIASAWRSPLVQSPLYIRNIRIAGPKQIGSAKPTYSEHHLGTTCDLTCRAVGYRLSQKFYYTKEYKWLKANIARFNMRITYSKTTHKQEGYMWEPWHVRYLGE